MALDEELADRVRDLMDGDDVTEQRMFGGLAFLVAGNMAVAASGQGGLMVRSTRPNTDALWPSAPTARSMEMRGRDDGGLAADRADDLRRTAS